MLSPIELLEGAGGGVLLSILGTYLHSRRKGAEALDSELQNHIKERDGMILSQNHTISSLQNNQPHKHREQRVCEWLTQMSARQRAFITWLLDHGDIEETLISKNSPPGDIGNAYEWGLLLRRLELRGRFGVTMIYINPDYKDALYAAIHTHSEHT